jgi:hypothetical protein
MNCDTRTLKRLHCSARRHQRSGGTLPFRNFVLKLASDPPERYRKPSELMRRAHAWLKRKGLGPYRFTKEHRS